MDMSRVLPNWAIIKYSLRNIWLLLVLPVLILCPFCSLIAYESMFSIQIQQTIPIQPSFTSKMRKGLRERERRDISYYREKLLADLLVLGMAVFFFCELISIL